jgi:predicted dehydrogenase
MRRILNRREFVQRSSAGALGLGLAGKFTQLQPVADQLPGKVGIIGLDTSHSTAFTKALNDPSAGSEFGGYRVVAAYPMGSSDIKSSVERIPGYTEEVKKMGVQIVNSIGELLPLVDVILLETNDGRLHLEQVLMVLKAGKRTFIDKPVAASLADAIAIFSAADHYKVPVFSSSSLRYIPGAREIREGSIGKVLGADVYSPATLEKTHPDLFWYGIHGVETLFTVMGTGCKKVVRTFLDKTDQVTGTWEDDRIGTFRGIRSGKADYGGTVFGEKGITVLGKYDGYNALLSEIIRFFQTGNPPVKADETIEIYGFMAAAELSKMKGGEISEIDDVIAAAKREADKKLRKLI